MNTYKTPSIVAVFQLLAIVGSIAGPCLTLYAMKSASAGLLAPGIGILSGALSCWAIASVIDYLAKAAHFAEQAALSLRVMASTNRR